ncbi:MAG: LysR family transcriptional regulator, partial [Gammaproteobacteria bacterium]
MHYPSFRQLQFFIALAEYRHFGRASRACHVSQAAFSLAIKALEERLDLPLVERGYKKVLLTPEGEEVLKQARRCH